MLTLDKISFSYPKSKETVLENVSFTLKEHTINALIGISGSGKSTLLKIILGFLEPSSGSITLEEKNLLPIPPEKRGIGMFFQNYLLFPHLTLKENIMFGLDNIPKLSKEEKQQQLSDILALTELTDLQDHYPAELSGGQQQRGALARALAPQPKVLLLDEPFSNLDSTLRQRIRLDMSKILRHTKTTALIVSHDIQDLIIMDNILFLNNRTIAREGTLEDFKKSRQCPIIFTQE